MSFSVSVAGEDSKISDAQHKDRKQSRTIGMIIQTMSYYSGD